MLVSPGPDLAYLTGYDAIPLERLTCLVLRDGGDPFLVVPGWRSPPPKRRPSARSGWISCRGRDRGPVCQTAAMIGR